MYLKLRVGAIHELPLPRVSYLNPATSKHLTVDREYYNFRNTLRFIIRFIDNALNGRNPEVFWEFLWVYGITLVIAIPIIISYRYTRRKLALFWRKWLTNTFLKDYFSNRAYYELDSNAANTDIDNPDQRMTEDVNSFTSTILDLILDILDSILDLVAFTGIL